MRRWRSGVLSAAVLTALLVTGCGGEEDDENDSDPTATTAAQSSGTRPCDDDGITLADLDVAEAEWPQRRQEIEEAGKAWQGDAVLVEVEVFCGIIGDLKWNGVYYSPSQEAWYSTERAEVMLPEEGPTTEPLDPSIVSFANLAEWLRADNFPETMVMGLGIEGQGLAFADG